MIDISIVSNLEHHGRHSSQHQYRSCLIANVSCFEVPSFAMALQLLTGLQLALADLPRDLGYRPRISAETKP